MANIKKDINPEQVHKLAAIGGWPNGHIQRSRTYVKSFMSVIVLPSCCIVKPMGLTDKRLHHEVHWKYAAPMILSPECKKVAR